MPQRRQFVTINPRLGVRNVSINDSALGDLADLTRLKQLHLPGNNITDDGLELLSGLVNLETLEMHTGWSGKIKGPGLVRLAGLKKLHQLGLLGLDDSVLGDLKGLTSL